MSIIHLKSLSQLNELLAKGSTRKLTVIDFHATWCGPCHQIAPVFEALAKELPNVQFFKCDVDAAKDVASEYRVSAMPTFVLLKGSTKVDQVRGADKNALRSAVLKHAGDSPASDPAAFTGKGNTLSGSSPAGNIGRDLKETADKAAGSVLPSDPQARVLMGLVVAYAVFWYMS